MTAGAAPTKTLETVECHTWLRLAVNDVVSALLESFENPLHSLARRQAVLEEFKADVDK